MFFHLRLSYSFFLSRTQTASPAKRIPHGARFFPGSLRKRRLRRRTARSRRSTVSCHCEKPCVPTLVFDRGFELFQTGRLRPLSPPIRVLLFLPRPPLLLPTLPIDRDRGTRRKAITGSAVKQVGQKKTPTFIAHGPGR